MSVVHLNAAEAGHLYEELFEGTEESEGGQMLAALSWAFAPVGEQVCSPLQARACSVALHRLAPGTSS
eukprot:1525661-Pyramimonas_sp.AAC.1